jgi:hypothetical protein
MLRNLDNWKVGDVEQFLKRTTQTLKVVLFSKWAQMSFTIGLSEHNEMVYCF